MLTSCLLMGALTMTALASEMDPLPATKSKVESVQASAKDSSNVIVVKVDETGKETYYAGQTTLSKDAIKSKSSAAEAAIAEIVTDKNQIPKPGTQSKDEMDQTTSTPQWFYVGFGGLGVGLGWAPSYYWYSYTYCPSYYYRPAPCYRPVYGYPRHHGPRHHYRFYWC